MARCTSLFRIGFARLFNAHKRLFEGGEHFPFARDFPRKQVHHLFHVEQGRAELVQIL